MIPRGKPAAEGGIDLPGRKHMHGEAAQDLQDDQDGDDCVQEPQVGFLEKTKELPEQFGLIAECGRDGHGVLLFPSSYANGSGESHDRKEGCVDGNIGEGEEELSRESSSSLSPDSFIYLNKQYEACLRPSAAKRDSR